MTDTVRVPRKPTEAMVDAGIEAYQNGARIEVYRSGLRDAYAAMLAASPQGEKESDCVCVQRGDGPEGCGLCNETGVATHSASPQGEGDWITHEEEPALERVAHLLRDHRGAYVTSEYDRGRADEIARLLACRAAPPASIKPSADTGELRERVAQIIGEAVNRRAPGQIVFSTLEDADAILDLIQSERAG